MEKLKYTLCGWNGSYGEIQNEEDTLDYYRTLYQNEISTEELEKHLISLDAWAQYAYENKLFFNVTAFLDDNDQPLISLTFNEGNIIVEFIDECNRIHMDYVFSNGHHPEKLFLTSLHYFIYPDNDNFYTMLDVIKDVQYIFTPEGKLTVWERYIDEKDGKEYEEAKEASDPVNIESNWETYPQLGEYDKICNIDRWGDGELAMPFTGENKAILVNTYDGDSILKKNTPYYRLTEDQQNIVDDAFTQAQQQYRQGKMDKAIEILENAFHALPEPKENYKAASDFIIKIVEYHTENNNDEEALRIISKLDKYLNADNYDALPLYKGKVLYNAGQKKESYNEFQKYIERRSVKEMGSDYPDYYKVFQKLI
ncbi:tetratricopeptide repeat protein [Aquimarina longa]|uniref:tetratricopeptide repeat protein n=1 Tax=Aquimarina longa TaxID=1080221 RepID=UPI000A750CDC|nr:hypothetical protein [Aquimarina longa]